MTQHPITDQWYVPRSRRGRMLLLLIVILFASFIGWTIKVGRDQERLYSTANNFRQLGVGLVNFSDSAERLPNPVVNAGESLFGGISQPDAEPLYSWRFTIVPFTTGLTGGSAPRPDIDFEKSWSKQADRYIRPNQMPYVSGSYGTNIFAITGPSTAFGDDIEPPRSLEEIDGDTILCAEIADSGLHWAAPGDFDIRTMPRSINTDRKRGISSNNPEGFHVIFADGTVWCLSHTIPFDTLEQFLTVEGARSVDRTDHLAKYRVKY